jgi:hypothetical protein
LWRVNLVIWDALLVLVLVLVLVLGWSVDCWGLRR